MPLLDTLDMAFIRGLYMYSRSVVGILLVTFRASCAEYRALQATENSPTPYNVSIGDKIKLVTYDSKTIEFTVTEITETSLIGRKWSDVEGGPIDIEVNFADIQQAGVKEFDVGKTAAGTGMTLLGVIVVIFAIAFATYGGA